MHKHHDTGGGDQKPKYEVRDLSISGLVWSVVVVFVVSIICAILMVGFDRASVKYPWGAKRPTSALIGVVKPSAPVGALLQVDPPLELHAFRERETKRLEKVGWVDKEKGVVHIPIEKAMQMVAERGLAPIQMPPPVAPNQEGSSAHAN